MKPQQIDYRQWHEQFKSVSDELIATTRYYRHLPDAEWSQYLFPPSTHAIYGNRLLKKLKYDNSLAALRLWGFVLSEGERIYRAKQAGMKVIAVMGDLGAVTPLIYSFPNTIAFYPDCLWWTPFLMESKVLFDEANEFGLGEDCCFVRAALGAYSKRSYFPKPDLCIGTVGATCDDMAAVISEAQFLGYPVHYFELPHRDDSETDHSRLKGFISDQYDRLCCELERVTGYKFDKQRFNASIKKVNRLRSCIADIKRTASESEHSPMGALELLNVEFAALSYYGDLDECILVLEQMKETVTERHQQGTGYANQDIRLVWITPPADPILMNYIENMGGRVVGSEFLINQTTPLFPDAGAPEASDPSSGGTGYSLPACRNSKETRTTSSPCYPIASNNDKDAFDSLAEAHLCGTLMGSTHSRTELVVEQVKRSNADGAIISGIFGSSHCPYETVPIVEALRSISVPTLSFDVVAPGKRKVQSQVYNRMEAFMESLHARRARGR